MSVLFVLAGAAMICKAKSMEDGDSKKDMSEVGCGLLLAGNVFTFTENIMNHGDKADWTYYFIVACFVFYVIIVTTHIVQHAMASKASDSSDDKAQTA